MTNNIPHYTGLTLNSRKDSQKKCRKLSNFGIERKNNIESKHWKPTLLWSIPEKGKPHNAQNLKIMYLLSRKEVPFYILKLESIE